MTEENFPDNMREREWLFCKYSAMNLSPREAAARSGYKNPEKSGLKLLRKKRVLSAVESMTSNLPTKREVANGLRRLAFGSISDIIRLMKSEDISDIDLDSLDLSLVSELKFPKGGGVEVKLCDRIKALQLLSELSEDEDAPDISDFFSALSRSAENIKDAGEEE